MKLLEMLVAEIEIVNQPDLTGVKVSGIEIDSREDVAGAVFIALPGTQVDGHEFIQQAVDKGASAVLGSRAEEEVPKLSVPYLQVRDSRSALAQLAAAWHNHPARKLLVIGVTGTDGKTTTANLIFQILRQAGLKVGLISTVNAVIGEKTVDTGFHVTTPEAADVQVYLSRMVEEGLTHVVLEATSHGLAQKRVEACEFDVGVVTNITHEHLDYHGSYQAYFQAKARLFELVGREKKKNFISPHLAVINRDDRSFTGLHKLAHALGLKEVTYGFSSGADYRTDRFQGSEGGLAFEMQSPTTQVPVQSSLVGEYNVSNILGAVAAAVEGAGVDLHQAVLGVAKLRGIPGRMEQLDLGQDFKAIVDFAHTPNALEKALHAARKMTSGNLIAVFGSAGLRDKQKRRLMAEVSGRLSDITVLTAEDPRTESLSDILEEMAQGISSQEKVEGKDYFRIPDRGDAIRKAIDLAQEDDVVIICGKGHEQSMCFGDQEYAWDDRRALKAALSEFLGQSGPDMPYLPTRQV